MRIKETLMCLATLAVSVGLLFPGPAHAGTSSYTKKYHPALEGSFLPPCTNQVNAGSFNDALNGVCFKLNGQEAGPASITIQDVSGQGVQGAYRFWQYGPENGGSSTWQELDGHYFCGNSIALASIPVPDFPSSFYLEITLGAGELPGCPGAILGGTAGSITFSFMTP